MHICKQKCALSHKYDEFLLKKGDPMESSAEQELLNTISPQSLPCQPDVEYKAPENFDELVPGKLDGLSRLYYPPQVCAGDTIEDMRNLGYFEYSKLSKLDPMGRLVTPYQALTTSDECCDILEYQPIVESILSHTTIRLDELIKIGLSNLLTNSGSIEKLGEFLSPVELSSMLSGLSFYRIDDRIDHDLKWLSDNIDDMMDLKALLMSTGIKCEEWLSVLRLPPHEIFLKENKDLFFELIKEMGEIRAKDFGKVVVGLDKANPDILRKNASELLKLLIFLHKKIRTSEDLQAFNNSFTPIISLARLSPNFPKFAKLVRSFEYEEREGPNIDPFLPRPFKKVYNERFVEMAGYMAVGLVSNLKVANEAWEEFSDLIENERSEIMHTVSDKVPWFRPLTTQEEWGKKTRSYNHLYNLRGLISAISYDILKTAPDILKSILDNSCFGYAASIFVGIRNIKNYYMLKSVAARVARHSQYVEYYAGADLNLLESRFRLFDYMVMIGMDDDEITDALNNDWYLRDKHERPKGYDPDIINMLFTDHRDGSDLRHYDPSKVDIYRALFENSRKMLYGDDSMEFAEQIDVSGLVEKMNGRGLIGLVDVAVDVENTVSPFISKKIYELIDTELAKPLALQNLIGKYYDDTRKKIDVTQNNISDINTLLKLLLKIKGDPALADLDSELTALATEYTPRADVDSSLRWLAAKFDVEEIDFNAKTGVDLFAEYVDLMSMLDELKNMPATRYLGNKLSGMGAETILSGGADRTLDKITDIDFIEALRWKINQRNKVLGDQLIDSLGSGFLMNTPASFDTLPRLMAFAKVWEVPNERVDKDVNGLYRQFSRYALDMVAGFLSSILKENNGDISAVKEALVSHGIDYAQLLGELEIRGFSLEREGKYAKGIKRLATNAPYVMRRLSEDDSPLNIDMDGVSIIDSSWPAGKGVRIKSILDGDRELAKLFVFDPSEIAVDIEANRSGVVDTKGVEANLGDSYIFSAPMTMTTGVHKMTELVVKDGQQISYLWTPESKDGILLVSENGLPKVLDKRSIRLGDIINAEDAKRPGIAAELQKWARARGLAEKDTIKLFDEMLVPSNVFWDKALFLRIATLKRYSILSNILILNGDEAHLLKDGNTDRRFFVELKDGSFGIIDSTENMSTGDLARLAIKAGAKKAIYMDTGMYDFASFRDGNGQRHVIGHKDTEESTNRVFVYRK